MSRPNVLVLLTDDQRFDTIAALGNGKIHTPNLDRLARRGTSFTRAAIMGGSCGAVCMPSRAMLHTGRTLYRIAGQGETIDPAHVMLGEHLARSGYATWACGKWHNGREAFARSFGGGAEIFFGGMADHWNVPVYEYDPSGKYDATLPCCKDAFHSNELEHRHADHIRCGVHSSTLLADAAVRALREQSGEKPFFMYVAFLAPHDPRTMPQRFREMYDADRIELPPNYLPVHPFDNGSLAGRDEELEKWPRTEQAIRRHVAEYYGMISHLDHEIGRILDALEAGGLGESTIVVFAGDNGLACGQHGLMGKQSLYEHSVRVPLIFAGPGIPADARREQFCYLSDLYPTLCDLAGLEIPDTVEGRSLRPDLQRDAPGPATRYHCFQRVQRAVRDDRYKLIEYVVGGRRRTQLFDLREDPWEMRNLAGERAASGEVARLRKELARLRDEHDDHRAGQGGDFWAGFAAEGP